MATADSNGAQKHLQKSEQYIWGGSWVRLGFVAASRFLTPPPAAKRTVPPSCSLRLRLLAVTARGGSACPARRRTSNQRNLLRPLYRAFLPVFGAWLDNSPSA